MADYPTQDQQDQQDQQKRSPIAPPFSSAMPQPNVSAVAPPNATVPNAPSFSWAMPKPAQGTPPASVPQSTAPVVIAPPTNPNTMAREPESGLLRRGDATAAAQAAQPTPTIVAPPNPDVDDMLEVMVPRIGPYTSSLPPQGPIYPVASPLRSQAPRQVMIAAPQDYKAATTRLWDAARNMGGPGWLRTLASVGAGILRGADVAAESLVPGIASQIPGSEKFAEQKNAQNQKNWVQGQQLSNQAQEIEVARQKAAADALAAQTATNKEAREANGEWRGVPELGVEVNSVSGDTRPMQGINPTLLMKQTPEDMRPQPNVTGTNQQLEDRWDALYPDKPIPKEFQLGPDATVGQYKQADSGLQRLESVAGTAEQRKFNQNLAQQNADIHKTEAEINEQANRLKLSQAQSAEDANADQAHQGLYAQQNYKDRMEDWYKSGKFAKDSGLIAEQLKGQGAEGARLGPFAGLLTASPLGAVGVVGAEGIASALTGPVNGYLDTLKKAGISNEGYAAMQAYADALLGRMQYEMGTMGLKASAMRSRALIEKSLATVPPPNVRQDQFENGFKQYYQPMETSVERRKFATSPGYAPPSFEDSYGRPRNAAATKPATQSGPPQGVTPPQGWTWIQQAGGWGITDGKNFRPYQGQ